MNAKIITAALLLVTSGIAFSQQPNSGYAEMTLNGANGPPFPINTNIRTSLPVNFAFMGSTNQPYAVFQGAGLSPNAWSIPANNSQNKVDLSLNPFPHAIIDGFTNPFFMTDFSGTHGFAIPVPPAGSPPNGIPLGFQLSVQALLADPFSSIGFTLTAATRVTVVQGPVITNTNLGDEGYFAVNVAANPIPFYGVNYTNLHVNANGYVCFGSPDFSDFTPTMSEFISGPPRAAPFWTDLDQNVSGTTTVTTDTPQNGNPGYVRFDWNNVEGWTVSAHHTFWVILRTDGTIDMAYGQNHNPSLYDQITGIGPGNPYSQAQKNFVGMEPVGSSVGQGILTTWPYQKVGLTNEGFIEWYGVTGGSMPNYGNPYSNYFDLLSYVLHFQPNAPGSGAATTTSYTLL